MSQVVNYWGKIDFRIENLISKCDFKQLFFKPLAKPANKFV